MEKPIVAEVENTRLCKRRSLAVVETFTAIRVDIPTLPDLEDHTSEDRTVVLTLNLRITLTQKQRSRESHHHLRIETVITRLSIVIKLQIRCLMERKQADVTASHTAGSD